MDLKIPASVSPDGQLRQVAWRVTNGGTVTVYLNGLRVED